MMSLPDPDFMGRHLRLDGSFNFRDAGRYRTRFDCPIRAGRLFRAGAPHQLTDRDVKQLKSLDISTIIDLRAHGEKAHRYSDVLDNVAGFELPMFDAVRESQDFAQWRDPTVVARRYREILDDAHEVVADILAILTDPASFPVLIHCTAGKDRTGIVLALLQSLLGVDDSTIFTDYAMSAEAMPQLVASLAIAYPDAHERLATLAPALLIADPAIMQELFRGLRREHGSIEQYIASLGVESAIPYLRSALLDRSHSRAA